MIKLDFGKIGNYITKKKLWSKAFADFEKADIKMLAEVFLDATEPKDGFKPPYLTGDQLIIPYRAPLKYRWWQGGQSIYETLTELGASDEVKAKYTEIGRHKGIQKKD